MYNDFYHREWWTHLAPTMLKLSINILLKYVVSDVIIENGKGILITKSMFFSCCFDTVS